MSTPPDGQTRDLEPWKALIDFSKVAISISSAALAALIGYYTLHSEIFLHSWKSIFAPGFLTLSILAGIFSIGKSIDCIKGDDVSIFYQNFAIFLGNASAYAMFLGLITIPLLQTTQNRSLTYALSSIEQQASSFNEQLTPAAVEDINLRGDIYDIIYATENSKAEIHYSLKQNLITGFRVLPAKPASPPCVVCQSVCATPGPKPLPPHPVHPRPPHPPHPVRPRPLHPPPPVHPRPTYPPKKPCK